MSDIFHIINKDAAGGPQINAVNNCVILNPSTIDADHIKTMCTIYRYVMIRLYCYFQSRALGPTPSGAPITLPSKIIFNGSIPVIGGGIVNISTLEFFKFINDGFILRMDLDRMGKPGEVISRRNTNPPGLYSTLLNNVKKPQYKPYARHILGNIKKNFQSGNVVLDPRSYVFACTQRDHIDAHEDYIYNLVNLISNVEYNSGKPVYSFGMGYILSPGNTGCAVNVCAFIGIFILAMILYILREHSGYFTSSNGTNESMLLNTYSLLNTCNIVNPMSNFENTNNMYLYKFTLDTSVQTQRAVVIGGDGIRTSGSSGTFSFQPYSPAVISMQLLEAVLDPVINEIKRLALQTVQAQIQLWGQEPRYTSIIKVLGRFLPKYDPSKNNGIPEYKHLWGHCYGIYIHIINKITPRDTLQLLLSKYGITSLPDPNIIDVGGTDYCFLISIAEPYFSRGLISYEPTFTQPNKFKIPYLQLHKPYIDNFNTEILISDIGHNCSSLRLPIKLLDTLTLRTLLDLQYYSDCRCYTSIEFQFVVNKPSPEKFVTNQEKTIGIVSYVNLSLVHSTCSSFSNLSVNSEHITPEIHKREIMEHLNTFKNAAKTLMFSRRWTNYTLMKKDSTALAKIDENLKLAMPDIVDVNTEIATTIATTMGDIFKPATLDSLTTIMSMIGSFNKGVSDLLKSIGYISIAFSGDPLNPEELISTNDYDNFYNYEDVDESHSGGGNKIINMKGGTKFNDEKFNKLIDIVELSGKVNLLIYFLSKSNDDGNLKLLLQNYNFYLEDLDTDVEKALLEKLNLLLTQSNIDIHNYQRLFLLYNCVLKQEEILSNEERVIVDSEINTFFDSIKDLTKEQLFKLYTPLPPVTSNRKSSISPDFTQTQIVGSGSFQELPDLYIGLSADIQNQLLAQPFTISGTVGDFIGLVLPTLDSNIIKGIYFALHPQLQEGYKESIIRLLHTKQTEIVGSVGSGSFPKLVDLYIGLSANIQEQLLTLPFTIPGTDGNFIVGNFIGLVLPNLHENIQISIMNEIDETLIPLLRRDINTPIVKSYYDSNIEGNQILQYYDNSSVGPLKSQYEIINGPNQDSIQKCSRLTELYLANNPDIQFLLFKNLNSEIQDYLLPHLPYLQLRIATEKQTKIVTELIFPKLVELYSTLPANIQEQLLAQPFTILGTKGEEVSGDFSKLVLPTLPQDIKIGIYSELDAELQKKIISYYAEQKGNFSILLKYSKFKGIRELIGIYEQASQDPHEQAMQQQHEQAMQPQSRHRRGNTFGDGFYSSRGQQNLEEVRALSGWRGGSKLERTRRKHHNKRKTIKRKKNRKTYKKRLHKNRKRRTHKG